MRRRFHFILTILCALLPTSGFAEPVILMLGDSLTEGYGINKEHAFPALIEKKLHSLGKTKAKVINGGESGATTASGRKRLEEWFIPRLAPQIVVLALGANDGLRGFDVKVTKENLRSMIRVARARNIKVLLAGMTLPPNYTKAYVAAFTQSFRDLAKEEKVPLIPFLLEGVGGVARYNLEDGIHPNKKGHEIIAETVWTHIKPLL